MKLPISKLDPTSTLSEDSFFVVDKEVDGTWKSYKARLSSIKNFMTKQTGNKYTVILDPNGGTLDGSSATKTITLDPGQFGDRLPTPISQPSLQGCAGLNFDGWWTSSQGGIKITEDRVVPETGQITLYAHWIGVIHYTNVGGVSINSNNVASGFSSSKYLKTIADDKFDFSGNWTIVMKLTANGEHPAIRQDVFGANTHLDFGPYGMYAQWEVAEYISGYVTYNSSEPIVGQTGSYTCWLKVVKNTSWAKPIHCYFSKNGTSWNNNYEGPGNSSDNRQAIFYIGIDGDSSSEYLRSGSKVYLDQCYLVQESDNAGNPKGKYILKPQT